MAVLLTIRDPSPSRYTHTRKALLVEERNHLLDVRLERAPYLQETYGRFAPLCIEISVHSVLQREEVALD